MATEATINTARKLLVSIAKKGAQIESLMDKLRGLDGMDYAAFESVRIDFVNAYCEARGLDPKDKAANAAARKGWSRIMAALGIEKPKSETDEAQRKRQARQAAKANVADDGEPEPVAPVTAPKIGEKIQMELAPYEAHIVSLIRRRQMSAAIEFIHRLAEQA